MSCVRLEQLYLLSIEKTTFGSVLEYSTSAGTSIYPPIFTPHLQTNTPILGSSLGFTTFKGGKTTSNSSGLKGTACKAANAAAPPAFATELAMSSGD